MVKKYLVYSLLLFFAYPSASFAQQPEQIRLWPGNPPDGPGPSGPEQVTANGSYTNISEPRLIVYRPDHPNGMAVLVISGGGYAHIECGKESAPAARWLQSQGFTAF